MENDGSDQDLEDNTSFRRRISNRSLKFSSKETMLLLDLIETHKLYILNKSSTAPVTRAKDTAWAKIANVLNNRRLGPKRTPEHLKSKWDRLKQSTRRVNKDKLDNNDEKKKIYNRIIQLMQIADSIGVVDDPSELLESANFMNGNDEQKHDNSYDADIQEEQSDNYMDDGDGSSKPTENRSNPRSLNYSPDECSLLLKCVRSEKDYIFNKECTAKAIQSKNKAWARVAKNYNKLSPTKRSTRVLRAKFKNLKIMARKLGYKSNYSNLPVNNSTAVEAKAIKVDPSLNLNPEQETSNDCMNSPQSDHDFSDDYAAADHDDDPLSSAINCDSGAGTTQEDMKLRTELLKIQIENAKLEQKRLAQSLAEEESAREARALESALRLRAARLEAIAATNKFPAGHPALLYTDLEEKAQSYLSQFQNT